MPCCMRIKPQAARAGQQAAQWAAGGTASSVSTHHAHKVGVLLCALRRHVYVLGLLLLGLRGASGGRAGVGRSGSQRQRRRLGGVRVCGVPAGISGQPPDSTPAAQRARQLRRALERRRCAPSRRLLLATRSAACPDASVRANGPQGERHVLMQPALRRGIGEAPARHRHPLEVAPRAFVTPYPRPA